MFDLTKYENLTSEMVNEYYNSLNREEYTPTNIISEKWDGVSSIGSMNAADVKKHIGEEVYILKDETGVIFTSLTDIGAEYIAEMTEANLWTACENHFSDYLIKETIEPESPEPQPEPTMISTAELDDAYREGVNSYE